MKTDKLWTYLILGLIGFFVVLPVGASFVTAFLGSLDVDFGRLAGLALLALCAVAVLWFLVAVLGGSGGGKHGSGQRALAQAQRDLANAVESVRAHHTQRMFAERQDQDRRIQALAQHMQSVRAKDGSWCTPEDEREVLEHA